MLVFVYFRVPFDWRSPFGYIMYLMFYVPGIFCVIYAAVPPICFYAGSCLLFIAFVQDIEDDLNVLMVKNSDGTHDAKLKAQFFEIVQVYSEVKELGYLVFCLNNSNISNRIFLLSFRQNLASLMNLTSFKI